ncbi:MAG: hypothetical protein AAF821_26125 [Cyanobacteria bacterium P01_D01_bin.156]
MPQDEEKLATGQTNQQNVANNFGHVIWRVDNLSIYYSSPPDTEPPPLQATNTSEIGPNPYRGLRAFREEDHAVFFGRRQQTYQLWKRLKALYDHPSAVRFLPVYGPSGSGKSSLVRAGLLPVIGRHSLSSQEHTRVAILEPRTQPLKGLALALARMATGDDSPVAKAREFYKELQQRNNQAQYDGLWHIVRSLPGTEFSPVIVAVDQFEEIYSQCKDKRQQQIFINNLLTAAADQSRLVIVVVTLRSDFLGETQAHPWLNRLFSKHGYLVPTMNKVELRQAISKPAEKARHPLDTATVTLLIQETQQREGALPLLQVALSDIWNGLRDGKEPGQTLQEIGGVGGALAKKAEAIFQALTPEQQAIARRVFLGVIQLGEGTRDTRRRAQVSGLVAQRTTVAQVREVIERFSWREARLLTLAADNEGKETVEVTHEALIEHWRRLNDWLDNNRDDIRFQRQLESAIQNWQIKGQAEGLLWRPPDLDLLQDFHQRAGQNMTLNQLTFFQKSQLAEKRRKRMRQLGLGGLIAGLTITTITTALSVWYAQAANRSREESILQVAQAQIETSARLNAVGENYDALINALQSIKYLDKNKIDRPLVLAQAKSKMLSSFLELREIKHIYESNVNDLSFSLDGNIIAIAGETTAALWSPDGELINEFKLRGFELGDAEAIRFSPNGKTIAISTKELVMMYGLNGELIDDIEVDHEHFIHDIHFSPDGNVLAVAYSSGIVMLWNYQKQIITYIPKDASRVSPLTTFVLPSNIIDFSQNGDIIATADLHGNPKLWSLDGQLIASLQGHNGIVSQVRFSPDGNIVVTSGSDETVKLWRRDGQLITSWQSPIGRISDIRFSPDGKIIAIASFGGSVRLLTHNGQIITSLQGHSDQVNEVRFSADGDIIATASGDGTAKLWSLDGKLIASFQENGVPISGVHFSPDGSTIATLTNPDLTNPASRDPSTVSGERKATIWYSDKTLIPSLRVNDEIVNYLDISPDGKTIATAGADGITRLWDLNGRLITSLKKHNGEVYQVIFSSDGNTIATASTDKTVKLWNYTGELLVSLPGEDNQDVPLDDYDFIYPDFSPDGNLLITILQGDDDQVMLWNRDGQFITSFENSGEYFFRPLFSPDSNNILTTDKNGKVYLWNKKGQLITSLTKHASRVTSAAFSSDGNIVTASEDGMIFLWSQDGQFITSLKQHSDQAAYNIFFAPDSSFVGATINDETKLWNLRGEIVASMKGRYSGLSSDSNIIATVDSGTVKLWGFRGNFINSIKGTNVRFNPGGNTISIFDNGTVELWSIDGTPLISLEEQNSELRFIRLVPGEDTIITNNAQGIVRLWKWNPDWVVNKACQQIQAHFSKKSPDLEEDKNLCIDTASDSESVF